MIQSLSNIGRPPDNEAPALSLNPKFSYIRLHSVFSFETRFKFVCALLNRVSNENTEWSGIYENFGMAMLIA